MEAAKISFRTSTEQKNSLIQTAKQYDLTLTQYLLWILDMHVNFNSMDASHATQATAEKNNSEIPKIIKSSDIKFEAEFEKEISNAYLKGYQDGKKEGIKINLKI